MDQGKGNLTAYMHTCTSISLVYLKLASLIGALGNDGHISGPSELVAKLSLGACCPSKAEDDQLQRQSGDVNCNRTRSPYGEQQQCMLCNIAQMWPSCVFTYLATV